MRSRQELHPLSLIIHVALGWAFYNGRRYHGAVERLQRTSELDPNYRVTHWILGLFHRKVGRYESAIAEGEKGVSLSGGSALRRAALAHTYGLSGRTDEARQTLDDRSKLPAQKYVAPTSFLREFMLAWEKLIARSNSSTPTKNTPTG